MEVVNTLAYYDTATIMSVKRPLDKLFPTRFHLNLVINFRMHRLQAMRQLCFLVKLPSVNLKTCLQNFVAPRLFLNFALEVSFAKRFSFEMKIS